MGRTLFLGLKILFYFYLTADKAIPCPYARTCFLEFSITAQKHGLSSKSESSSKLDINLMGKVKSFVTLKTSVTPEMQELINQQIKLEAVSSWAYLAAASWCDKEGFVGSAAYLYKHAEEERMHMMKFFNYLNNAGGHALAPAIKEVKYDFETLREVFEDALAHEIKVTHAINDLVDACLKMKDFATFQFLQWFVQEQREEEVISRRAVELFDIIGEEGQGIWHIDKAIGELAAQAEAADSAEAPAE